MLDKFVIPLEAKLLLRYGEISLLETGVAKSYRVQLEEAGLQTAARASVRGMIDTLRHGMLRRSAE